MILKQRKTQLHLNHCYNYFKDKFKDYLTPCEYSIKIKPGANESQKTLNKCETRNKTVFHTRLVTPK